MDECKSLGDRLGVHIREVVIVAIVLATPFLLKIDSEVVRIVVEHRIGPLNMFFYYFTLLGNYIFAIIEGLYVVIYYKDDRKFRYNVAVLISYTGWLVSDRIVYALKNIFMRPRPYEACSGVVSICGEPKDYSFPSGHSSTAFSLIVPIVLETRSKIFRAILIIYAVLICFSRIYCGVHYLTDVIWGALIGWYISNVIYYLIWRRIGDK